MARFKNREKEGRRGRFDQGQLPASSKELGEMIDEAHSDGFRAGIFTSVITIAALGLFVWFLIYGFSPASS